MSLSTMNGVVYKVTLCVGQYFFDRSTSKVYIKLVGEQGETGRTLLTGAASVFGKKYTYDVPSSKPIGKLILIQLEKKTCFFITEPTWFVDTIEVTTPEKETSFFPVYHWIKDDNCYTFREGTALLKEQDTSLAGQTARAAELEERQKLYCWTAYADGLPHCIKAKDPSLLPWEVQFSFTKNFEFKLTAFEGVIEMLLEHLIACKDNWESFDAIYDIFSLHKSSVSEFVQKNWKDDAFFGYQFLNGLDPTLIRRCDTLLHNYPVAENTLNMHGGGNLVEEMQRGNIFYCDYKNLEGVKANVIDGKQQYLAAPVVLLHKTPDDELKPIAIQLNKTPAADNPIFYPSDSEYDWLLAKTFVRSAYFNEHELNAHLLRTHLLSEVFSVALLRNLPMIHPLYKLLIPHTRYTLQINILARQLLISPTGGFTLFTSSGGEAMMVILQRSLSSLTYTSLCLPDNIAERGMDSLPNYYYRDDGLALWNIIHKFVNGILSFYYKDNNQVKNDSELQCWIKDIFEHGFLSNESSEIPQQFDSREELVKFVTMVIFTSSAQHAAVNSGQYDLGSWMPNSPSTLQLPPPTQKGIATEETLLNTLPNKKTTVHAAAILHLLSTQSSDFVALGQYPNQYFYEQTPLSCIENFQKELGDLHDAITERNTHMKKLPYSYLDPKLVENSVSL